MLCAAGAALAQYGSNTRWKPETRMEMFLDVNRDGKVDRADFPLYSDVTKLLDINGDHVVSRDEAYTAEQDAFYLFNHMDGNNNQKVDTHEAFATLPDGRYVTGRDAKTFLDLNGDSDVTKHEVAARISCEWKYQ